MTDSLLSRLQSLTEPSREIDAEIALAESPWLNDYPRDDREGDPGWMTNCGRAYPPRYTESLDAALTLKRPGLNVVLRWRDPPTDAACTVFFDGSPKVYTGRAVSPAIALLIALEKAKEESKP